MTVTPITPNATRLTKYGIVSCYLVREESSLTLIDAVLPKSHDAILGAAADIGLPIQRIALTHAHEDHIGAVDALLAKRPSAQLASSQRSVPLLRKPADTTLAPDEPHGPGEDKIKGPLPGIDASPTHMLADGELYGSLRVIATPGHIPGHLSFLDERDGTLFAGDALLTMGRLRVCIDSPWYFPTKSFSWSTDVAIRSANRLLDYPIQRFACAHGKVLEGGRALLENAILQAERAR